MKQSDWNSFFYLRNNGFCETKAECKTMLTSDKVLQEQLSAIEVHNLN
jgi:hypothetical protein